MEFKGIREHINTIVSISTVSALLLSAIWRFVSIDQNVSKNILEIERLKIIDEKIESINQSQQISIEVLRKELSLHQNILENLLYKNGDRNGL